MQKAKPPVRWQLFDSRYEADVSWPWIEISDCATENDASSASCATAIGSGSSGGRVSVDRPSRSISTSLPSLIVNSAKLSISLNEVNWTPAAIQYSPIAGAMTPLWLSWAIALETWSPTSAVGVELGPAPVAQAIKGNCASCPTGGITSARLNPKPADNPVTKKNGGPPSSASSTP